MRSTLPSVQQAAHLCVDCLNDSIVTILLLTSGAID